MSSDGVNGNEPNVPKPPSVPIPKPKALDLGAWGLWLSTAVFVTLGTTWWWPS